MAMIEKICNYLKNYFVRKIESGKFTIKDGKLPLSFLQNNQYFRIVGSIFNDGIYQYNDNLNLIDETFSGEVWAMAIPPTLIALASEIESYIEENRKTVSPYISESFGGYSYTKQVDKDGNIASWQNVFANQLKTWRKI